MNKKESTPLEAFYDLIDVYFDNEVVKEKYGITKQTFIEKKKIIETALKALQIIKRRILIDEDMGIIETKDEPSFGKVAHLHSITFQILSDEENYDLIKEVLL